MHASIYKKINNPEEGDGLRLPWRVQHKEKQIFKEHKLPVNGQK